MRITIDSDKTSRGICSGELREFGKKVLHGIEKKESGLFEALLKPERTLENCLIVTKPSHAAIWNTIMGHASANTMSKTFPLVNGVTLKNCDLNGKCEVCIT